MIKSRSEGDNITLLNTLSFKRFDGNKFKEYLSLIYKDCDTGLKYVEEIEDPDYEYYVIKDDHRVDYPRTFVPKENVEIVTVPNKELEKSIAKQVGLTEYFYENIKNNNRGENKRLHTHPDIFNSDMNIEDHYRFRFSKLYKNEPCKITKSFFDIEVDTINMIGDFPEPGECPINAITLILQEEQQVYTFLLRNKSNPLIQEFEDEVNKGGIFKELEEFVINAVGGPAMAEKYNIHFKYNFLFYDEEDEINLIIDLFNAINLFKPDFALAWNMGFDLPYIIARIQRLGYNPDVILSNPDFENKIAQYYIDERNKSDFAERGDFALISSYTTFLDQMIHFASRRKGQGKLLSFSLDYIGEIIAKVKKLDYKHITTNISELPYKDYKTFVFYNIMDTIVQNCIEVMTGDIDYVFSKCNLNVTRYSKCHRQTVYLANRGIKEFYKDGFVMGNNVNKFNQKPTEKFPGAFVADPMKVDNHSRLFINGRPVCIFDNLDDYDYASLYPSLIRQFNIAAHTQIGMVIIPEQVYANENKAKLGNWTRASEFMENFQSQMWLEICCRWFNLANYTELYHEIEEFFTNVVNPYNGLRTFDRNGYIIPMVFDNRNLMHEVVFFEDTRRNVEDVYKKPDLFKWEEWRNNAITHGNQHF